MNRIAELRKKAGWSQAELAEALGIAQNTISQYENELRTPSSRVVLRLSNLFGVSPNYLLGEDESPGEIRPTTHDIQLATKIIQESDINRVNLYLRKGWRLIHVGEDRESRDDGTGYSSIVYTVAWFGHPQHSSANELPFDSMYDNCSYDL